MERLYYTLNQISTTMDLTISEQLVQHRIKMLLPSINSLTILEVKECIFENRKQELQRQNLRNAWRCRQSLDPLLTIEQEFSLHKDSAIDADCSIEVLRAILVFEIETSLKKQLEVQSWMAIGGEVP